jgi:methyl-accepting chemotaxis protein
MKAFNNLSTAAKLLVGFGFMVALLVLVTLVASRALLQTERDAAIALAASGLENNLNENRATVLSILAVDDATERAELRSAVAEHVGDGAQYIRQLRALAQGEPAVLELVERFDAPYREFIDTQTHQTLAAVVRGDFETARQVSLGIQHGRFERLRDISRALAAQAQQQGREQLRRTQSTFWLLGAFALASAALVVWLLTRSIAAPLREITHRAERISTGDLPGEHVEATRRDEVGALQQAFAQMTARLREMAQVAGRMAGGDLSVQVEPQSERDVLGQAFATMVTNLRGLTAELHEGINVLSASASQISTSTSQLAASASETATAVSETTTTVEEVRQTAHVASQKARLVADSSQRVASVSEAGRRSTEDTAAGIGRIQQQMESIAESMVRLSEQSQAVGQIVATVEDLAGQSKLLAVNASIEAAKAGEHGKGFAVVAQEVKSLAEQSRQATAQVRSILGDIQHATSAAVLATEQGSHAVADGVRQSATAGESIQALSGSVSEAADAAVQIAASSQQQLVGVDQVAAAMESIKQASLQNVDSAKQLESAAYSIKLLGDRLKQLASGYRL